MDFSLTSFPSHGIDYRSDSIAPLKDVSGLPWGCTIRPLDDVIETPLNEKSSADSIGRCEKCFAYINPYATFLRERWRCPLCKTQMEFGETPYASLVTRSSLPELKQNYVEFVQSPLTESCTNIYHSENRLIFGHCRHIIFEKRIDGSNASRMRKKRTFGSHRRSSKFRRISAVPDFCHFGLITFSDEIGIFNLKSNFPHVLHSKISANGETLELNEVISPTKAFAKVRYFSDIFQIFFVENFREISVKIR